MAKKDFTQLNTENVYAGTIAEATQDPAKRKARKEYTTQEAQEFLENGNTTGRKGVKLPRINLAFNASNYDYIVTMSKAAGLNLTEFVNLVIKQHREAHEEMYQQALDFRAKL